MRSLLDVVDQLHGGAYYGVVFRRNFAILFWFARSINWAHSKVILPHVEERSCLRGRRGIFTPLDIEDAGLWSSGTTPHSHCGGASSILARSTRCLTGRVAESGVRLPVSPPS